MIAPIKRSDLQLLIDPLRALPQRRHDAVSVLRFAEQNSAAVVSALQRHGLIPLWLDAMLSTNALQARDSQLIRRLKREQYRCTSIQMLVDRLAENVFAALEQKRIRYVAFKGYALARTIYSSPTLRPLIDLDVWVAAEERDAAIHTLCASGLKCQPNPLTVSHEVMLLDDHVPLDLHWHFLRPGRLRRDLTTEALATRQRCGHTWMLSDSMTLLVLLLSPVFSEHLVSRLLPAVDLDRWVRQTSPDWVWLQGALTQLGVAAAAWTMLTWTKTWLATPIPDDVLDALAPPLAQTWLLKQGLQGKRPLQAAQSLLFHDRPSDAARAVLYRCRAAVTAQRRAARLNLSPQSPP